MLTLRRHSALIVMAIYFAVLLVIIADNSQGMVDILNSFSYGDWLVNYHGGFARRGLAGEIILALSGGLDVSPLTLVTVLHLGLYGATCTVLIAAVRDRKLTLWFWLLVCSPATFLFPVQAIFASGRKELFYILLLAVWMLYLMRGRGVSNIAVALCAVASVTMVLVHEGMAFFAPFFTAAYVLVQRSRNAPVSVVRALAAPASAFVAAAAVLAFGRPDPVALEAACAAIVAHGIDRQICNGTVLFANDLAFNMQSAADLARTHYYLIYYPLAAALALAPIALMAVSANERRQLPTFVTITGICIVATLPLYVLGADWGRWIYVTTMSILFLSVPLLEKAGPATTLKVSWRTIALTAMIVIYGSTWSIKHCCEAGLAGGLMQKHLIELLSW
jgi:hypothetical protein